MKTIQPLILIILTSLFFSCNNKSNSENINQFAGLWSLYQMQFYNPQTKEWSEFKNAEIGFSDGLKGSILYDNANHMSVHLVPKAYEKTDLKFPIIIDSLSIEALKHHATSYSYFANYTIDKEKKIIAHKRISHSNPHMWSETVLRKYSFLGDTLILQPIEKELAGTRLLWIKVTNANE
ncbi:lipocalin-like domain-containing protein [Saccharicrinis aurantiacus]|uniref:lipocalin-like domain-containing protein n=1 Tax=Saccharicrinis aurantiacus TaxID=1849719 RepID=UPI000837BEF4|nr:lipocalin-like domain-containing protein [Saccharicrinis aurantiacus]